MPEIIETPGSTDDTREYWDELKDSWKFCAAAAKEAGNIEMLNFLAEQGYDLSGVECAAAAAGRLDNLKWVHNYFPDDEYDNYSCYGTNHKKWRIREDGPNGFCTAAWAAARAGQLEVLEWLLSADDGPDIPAKSYLMIEAILNDRRDVIYWLAKVHGCERTEDDNVEDYAPDDQPGTEPYSYWMYDPWRQESWNECCVAAVTGNLPLFKWLAWAGYEPGDLTTFWALDEGYIGIAEWAVQNGFVMDFNEWSDDVCRWVDVSTSAGEISDERDVEEEEVKAEEREEYELMMESGNAVDFLAYARKWIDRWRDPPPFAPMPSKFYAQ